MATQVAELSKAVPVVRPCGHAHRFNFKQLPSGGFWESTF